MASTIEYRHMNSGDSSAHSIPHDYHSWDEDKLGLFFRKKGLGAYCAVLKTHKITGALAPLLQDDDLKEMGIDVIGDRLMFKHHLKELARRERFNRRIQSHWEGTEQVFFNDTEKSILVRFEPENKEFQNPPLHN